MNSRKLFLFPFVLFILTFTTSCKKDDPQGEPKPELPKVLTELSIAGLENKTVAVVDTSGTTIDLEFDALGNAAILYEGVENPVYALLKCGESTIRLGRKAGGKIEFTLEEGIVTRRVRNDSILIGIVEEMFLIDDDKESLQGIYSQQADLDFSGVSDWKPIGDSFSNPFLGTFDGNNHEISNLTIIHTKVENVISTYTGLFGIARDAVFENVHIVSGEITGERYVGGLTARLQGPKGVISNCTNRANVNATENGVGAFVGQLFAASVRNSVNYGKIVGKSDVGGIAGGVDYSTEGVSECENHGEIVALLATAGGIVGRSTSKIYKCNNYALISGDAGLGGIAGSIGGSSLAKIEECMNEGEIKVYKANAGGLAGSVGSGGSVVKSENNGKLTAAPKAPAEGESEVLVKYVGGITGSAAEGGIIEECTNNETAVFNVDQASGVGGISGFARKAKISKCINKKEIVSKEGESIGGIVGFNVAELIFCTNEVPISGRRLVGGVVGFNEEGYGKVRMCLNNGAVKGELDFTGGIAGITWGTISGSVNNGTVTGDSYTGGICGAAAGQYSFVVASYNMGGVTGTDNVGGVVGEMRENALTQASFSASEIKGDRNVGGVCGKIDDSSIVKSSFWSKFDGKGIASGTGAENDVKYFTDGSTVPSGVDSGWPASTIEHWGIGDGSNKNWWKNMGIKGSATYPALFWE
ncbi:MAG: hypothetical protein RRY23_05305 [Alistipes sp.]